MRNAADIKSDISDVETALDEFEEYFESAELALDNLPSNEVFHGADVKMAGADAIEAAQDLENTVEDLAAELYNDFGFSDAARSVGSQLSTTMHALSQARLQFETVHEKGRELHNKPTNSRAASEAEHAVGKARPHYEEARELVRSALDDMPTQEDLKSDFDEHQKERVMQERMEPNFDLDYIDE